LSFSRRPLKEHHALRRQNGGFTLIELGVVVLILVLLVATVTPKLTALRQGDNVRRFESDLVSMVSEAKSLSSSNRQTVQLTYDEGSDRFQLASGTDDDADRVLSSVTVPEGVQVRTFRLRQEDLAAGTWALKFYTDGSCDPGGVEVQLDRGAASMVVSPLGSARWSRTELGEPQEDRWQAGELEQRG